MRTRHETIQPATTTEAGTSATVLFGGHGYLYQDLMTVAVKDPGGSNAYTINVDHTPDASTWFEEYEARRATITADSEIALNVTGGFVTRVTGTKATSAEDLTVTVVGEYVPGVFQKAEIQAGVTVECGTSATALYTSTRELEDADLTMVYLDDNGNAQTYAVDIYLSPDKGTTWYLLRSIAGAQAATDRRIAIPIQNNGAWVKVEGTKNAAAEDILVTVEARKRTNFFKAIDF